jgi:hypothetical protein
MGSNNELIALELRTDAARIRAPDFGPLLFEDYITADRSGYRLVDLERI